MLLFILLLIIIYLFLLVVQAMLSAVTIEGQFYRCLANEADPTCTSQESGLKSDDQQKSYQVDPKKKKNGEGTTEDVFHVCFAFPTNHVCLFICFPRRPLALSLRCKANVPRHAKA